MSSQPMITEMAFLPFPEHTALHDSSTATGAVWKRILHDVRQAPGYCGSRWGYQLNKPAVTVVWYIVDWESIEAHTSYEQGPECASINEALFPMLAPFPPAPAPHMYHARLTPKTTVWDKGIVKTLLFHVSSDRPWEESEKAFAAAVSRVETMTNMRDGRRSIKDVAGGWLEEELATEDGNKIGKCKGYLLASSWPDMQQLEEGEKRFTDAVLGMLEGFHIRCNESIVDFIDSNGLSSV